MAADLARMIVDEAASQAKELRNKRVIMVDVQLHFYYHRELVVLLLTDHLVICFKAARYRVPRTDKEGCTEVMAILADEIVRDVWEELERHGNRGPDHYYHPYQLLEFNEYTFQAGRGDEGEAYSLTAKQLGEVILSKHFKGEMLNGTASGLQAALREFGNTLRYNM